MTGDPYLYPGTDVLRNRPGYRDSDELERFEAAAVARRQVEIARHGLPIAQDFERIKAIHRHLFQDVYDWAGAPRTITISKATFDDVYSLAALAARPDGDFNTRTGIHTFLAHDRIEVEAAICSPTSPPRTS